MRIAVVGTPGGWSTERLLEAVREQASECVLVDMDRVALRLETGQLAQDGQPLGPLDAAIVKKIGAEYSADHLDRLEMLRLQEERGLRLFSPPSQMLRLFSRVSGTIALEANHIPMPPTLITTDVGAAVQAVGEFGKAVFKPIYSTKARGMALIEAGPACRDAVEQFRAAGNPVLYIQKLLPIPGRDLGVVFLGGEYLATYARVAAKDAWNTTTQSGGRYVACEPSADVLAVAEAAQAVFKLDFTCVDVIETEDGPKVFEVSAFGGFRGLRDANGIDAAELYVAHVLKSLRS